MDEIMSISRHRMGTDGKGVTTLIGFWGCPLKCRYCINDFCHDEKTYRLPYSPQQLYEKIKIDNLYFKMTGGGVVFGGGEPLLHSLYISDVISFCPDEWRFGIETSLNVPWEDVERLIHDIDYWIIDVKDINPEIYLNYTQRDNRQVIANIEKLCALVDMERITFRIPEIPDFNTKEDISRSRDFLINKGQLDIFRYKQVIGRIKKYEEK